MRPENNGGVKASDLFTFAPQDSQMELQRMATRPINVVHFDIEDGIKPETERRETNRNIEVSKYYIGNTASRSKLTFSFLLSCCAGECCGC